MSAKRTRTPRSGCKNARTMARGPRRATTLGGHPRVQGDDASLEIVITLEMEGVQEGTIKLLFLKKQIF